jgi:serine/threonine-protein kinase
MGDPTSGICPSCNGAGTVGAPCEEPVCRRRGYRFLPGQYVSPGADGLPDPLIGLALGDYLLADLVGAGGMGRVYLGLQFPLLMPVAVKVLSLDALPPALHEALRQQFEAEARALSLIQHPNVVRLLHYGVVFRQPFLVMELVADGRTLLEDVRRRAEAGGWYGVEELRSLLTQALDGLGAAHAGGFIHRDIKPENLMLQSVVGHPLLLRILDFGLARFLHSDQVSGHVTGTPDYMAPEQANRGSLGPWTDLYALGVVAYELLTGTLAFGTGTVAEVLSRKLDPAWDPVARLGATDLPPAALRFLETALQRDPVRRYRNHEAMRLGLHEALDALAAAGPAALARVSPGGLLWVGESPTARPDARPPAVERLSGLPTERSDRALRRWLAQEQQRLAEAARRLRIEEDAG